MRQPPPDLRITRTRNRLHSALDGLFSRHNYARLTVREVTRLAKVGYTTFYRHYDNLDALVTEVSLGKVDALVAYARQQTTLPAETLAWYNWLRANEDWGRFYVSLPQKHPTRTAVKDAVVAFYSERYEAQDPAKVPLDFALEHMAEEMYCFYRWFVFHNDRFTVKHVAAMHVDIIVKGMLHSALKFRQDWLKDNPGFLVDADG